MNAPLCVIAFALLFGLWAVGMGLAWRGIDLRDREIQRLTGRVETAERYLCEADQQATAAEAASREWMAHADDLAAQIQRHTARCPWAAADPIEAEMN